ncbi:MAG: glycosyltransferase [Vampirovibrionales bacterium]|nr:glycosyltransferase [Vampirovibrionales bacterium]
MSFSPKPEADSAADDRQRPLVSVIMPAHNAADYIGEAIESVLSQTYPYWELLVVDDASSDATGAIVQEYQSRDPRVRYFPVERIGHPAGVRNHGFRQAQGDLIAFMDADDAYFPDALARLSAVLLAEPRATAAFGFASYMDETGAAFEKQPILLTSLGEGRVGPPAGYPKSWPDIVSGDITCMLPGLMLRRSVRERVGFFNEALCGPEDYEYYVRLYLDDYEGVRCLPAYIYRYRIHSASLTKSPEHVERVLESCLKIFDWLFGSEPRLPQECRQYRSQAYAGVYRYLARERLLNNQPGLCRKVAARAWGDPNVTRGQWFRKILPLTLRSVIPHGLDQWFVRLRWQLRRALSGA